MSAPTLQDGKHRSPEPRYEFRVWGDRTDASEQLSSLADGQRMERIDDCYLLYGDPSSNTKIRRSGLKIKRLEEERLGFQRWTKVWHRLSGDGPNYFDAMLEALRQGMLEPDDCQRMLARLVDDLDPSHKLRTVFVTKHRRRFVLGGMKAEATLVTVDGRPGMLSTVAIEGPDLHELIQLRSTLGLAHVPNLAFHLAVDGKWATV